MDQIEQMQRTKNGLNAEWLDVIGCPSCQQALQFVNGFGSNLTCQTCSRQYSIESGTPVLIKREDIEILTKFNQRYTDRRLKEGWHALSAQQRLALPFGQPTGYPSIYWQVRSQSYEALKRFLAQQGPLPSMGPAADLGAGNGWLSYNLAKSGYRVVAVDCSINEPFGLGAAGVYLEQEVFLVVQGDLNRPPLRAGKYSLVLFNASLHYARDLRNTLRRTAQTLLPEGWLVILDSPAARRARLNSAEGDRHLGYQELQDALLTAGLKPRWIKVRRSPRWWFHQAARMMRGNSPFSLPMIIAQRR